LRYLSASRTAPWSPDLPRNRLSLAAQSQSADASPLGDREDAQLVREQEVVGRMPVLQDHRRVVEVWRPSAPALGVQFP